MSLINKMLQDLDARRADVPGAESYSQQIRAVPERRRVNPVLWGVLGLALAASASGAWFWLHHPVKHDQGKRPLKLEADLKVDRVAAQPQASVAATAVVAAAPTQAVVEPAARVSAAVPSKKADDPQPTQAVEATAKQSVQSASPAEYKVAVKAAKMDAAPVAMPAAHSPEHVASLLGRTEQPVKEFTPPQLAENEYRKALVVLQQGRNSEAIDNLEHVLRLDTRHVAARQVLIRELASAGRADEAIRWAKEGIDIDPNQPGLAMMLARVQLDKGELRSAIETMERTLPYSADRADYLAFLAGLLQREGKHKQAAEQYVAALQRAPQNGVWWMGLGISLQAENRPSEAAESFKRAKATNTLSADLLAFVEARLNQLKP